MKYSLLPMPLSFVICFVAAAVQAEAPDSSRPLEVLLEQLGSTHTTQDRIRAAEALAPYGRCAVPPLIERLHSDDADTRYYACFALVRLGPCAEKALPDLMVLATRPDDPSQRTAMLALGRIGSPAKSAAPMLFRLALEGEWQVRECAIDALAEIGSCAVPMLLDQLRNDDRKARQSAYEVLGRMGPEAREAIPLLASLAVETTEMEREAVFTAIAGIGAPARDDLIRLLQYQDADVRRLAAKGLGRMQAAGPPVVPAQYYKCPRSLTFSQSQRPTGANHCGPSGSSPLVDVPAALCHAVRDRDANVRFWAVWALGEIGGSSREVADSLLLASLDRDADVRWQTVATLQKVNIGESVEQVLINLLKDPHPAVRAKAEQIGVQ